MDDPADHPAVIDPRHAPRLIGQKWLQARKLSFCEPEVVIGHGKPPNIWKLESKTAANGTPRLWVLKLSSKKWKIFIY
jgi:hypothetical protein